MIPQIFGNSPRAWIACLGGLLALFGPLPAATAQPVDVLTFHGDNARLGWNAREEVLTPRNVNKDTFGKLWETPLDSACYASPLAVSGVEIGGRKHDVVYAATENNSVFALDAGDGTVLWSTTQLAAPLTVDDFNGCPNVNPTVGITSTPVIDLAANTIYICGAAQPKLKQVYKVWALDIRTGKVKPGWPVLIQGSDGKIVFEGGQLVQRGALSLVNGILYIPFGARCDIGDWHGWVVGLDPKKPAKGQQFFCMSRTGEGGGLWCSGGLTTDADGRLYAATGNGEFAFGKGEQNLSEAVVRLSTGGKSLKFGGTSKDYYVPNNYKHLDDNDEDLGGAGLILLPEQPELRTPHLAVTGGKDGLVYLLNRDNLGGVGGEIQKERYFGDPNGVYHGNIRSMPAYFDAGPDGRFVYFPGNETGPNGEKGMVALKLLMPGGGIVMDGHLTEAWTLKNTFDNAATPAVSSNGNKDGVVWLIIPGGDSERGGGGALWAFDALNGNVLYRSDQATKGDALGDLRKFTAPVVANGRVFIAASKCAAFGLIPKAGDAVSAGEGK